MRRLSRVIEAPETNMALFAFLLNLPWELAQVPLFAGMPTARHWTAVLACGRAALGDVAIALAGFWAVAAVVGTRRWVLAPTRGRVLGFMAAGVAITIVTERLATGPLGRWVYAERMPIVPLVDVGLSPLLQWVVLPPPVVWFVRRQLT